MRNACTNNDRLVHEVLKGPMANAVQIKHILSECIIFKKKPQLRNIYFGHKF